MRIVKHAFEAVGDRLLYSRNQPQPGYYLQGKPSLSSEFKQILQNSAVEADQRQIDMSLPLDIWK